MTAALIVVEIDDLASAAHSMYGEVGVPLNRAAAHLSNEVAGCGAMAGSDPGGTAWASAYDAAASVALAATVDLTNAAYQVAAMFGQTARNWAHAESASTPNQAGHIVGALAGLPSPISIAPPARVPSAHGGSAPAPAGWELIAGLVHYVWPDGHQDLLHRSASAWQASADVLQECSDFATFADVGALADRLPEADDMNAVCQGLCRHLRTVAGVHRSLAGACTGLASRIDEVRHDIVGELESLAEWTAGIESVGLLFGVFSGGTSILGAQGVEAARISRTAVRVSSLIARFIDSARAACEGIPTAAAVVESISTSLTPLLGTQLAIAGVTSVRGMPTVKRAIETAEMAADRRLVAGAASGGQVLTAARARVLADVVRRGLRTEGMWRADRMTAAEAELVGKAWVGPGATLSTNGRAWLSRDGLRQYRPASLKVRKGIWEANIQRRDVPTGDWPHNGHIKIVDNR